MDFSSVGRKETAVTVRESMTLVFDRRLFEDIIDSIDLMSAQAGAVSVTDDDGAKIALDIAKQAKDLGKRMDAKRKELIDEPSAFVKSVNSFVKSFSDKLDAIEGGLKKKIGDFNYRKELARREAEQKAREAAKRLEAEMKQQAEEANKKAVEEAKKRAEEQASLFGSSPEATKAAVEEAVADAQAHAIEAPAVVTPVLPKETTITRTESGASAHLRMTWKAEITFAPEVPREYCVPNMPLINQAVKMGVRKIPGVKIFEAPSTVIR